MHPAHGSVKRSVVVCAALSSQDAVSEETYRNMRRSLYAFVGLAASIATAPFAAGGDITDETAHAPPAPSYGWEGPSPPPSGPQTMLSLLAVGRPGLATNEGASADIGELQFFWTIADDW